MMWSSIQDSDSPKISKKIIRFSHPWDKSKYSVGRSSYEYREKVWSINHWVYHHMRLSMGLLLCICSHGSLEHLFYVFMMSEKLPRLVNSTTSTNRIESTNIAFLTQESWTISTQTFSRNSSTQRRRMIILSKKLLAHVSISTTHKMPSSPSISQERMGREALRRWYSRYWKKQGKELESTQARTISISANDSRREIAISIMVYFLSRNDTLSCRQNRLFPWRWRDILPEIMNISCQK